MAGLAMLVCLGVAAPAARAATIYVSTTGADANNGQSWATAKKTVAAGLTAGVADDQVWVAAGTYVERITLKAGVGLYGGFAGNETDLAQRNWVTNVTILDGNQGGSVVTAQSGAAAGTRIDGFTIRNGKGAGGGVNCVSASPTILNNTITGNTANPSTGGGIHCSDSSPTISGNAIVGNTGSGVYCASGSAVISDNVIMGNSAPTAAGIFCPSTATISNNTITGNTAVGYGGGVFCGSSTRLSGNTITGNTATGSTSSAGIGGGVYCGGTPVVTNNIITGNTASFGGGIGCSTGASPTIANNVIAGNAATGYRVSGGAYYSFGGGFYGSTGSPVLSNNTITGNVAQTGGGLYCPGSPTISNNIVAFNSSGVYKTGTGTTTLRNNCLYNPAGYDYSGLSSGTGDISLDPQLLAVGYGNDHLEAGSPCTDAGDDAAVQAGWTDTDGELRVQGTHVDIGADEFNGTTPSFTPAVVRVSPSGSDGNDGSTWALAKLTVQAGIGAVTGTGGEVWVAGGTYPERIALKLWVHVYGGFAGTETSRDQRDWLGNPTVLDGGAGGSVVSVLSGSGISSVDGFTIRNGTGTLVNGNACGGGIYCISSMPVIANNVITANSALVLSGHYSAYGGGIHCSSAAPTIANNTIANNTAAISGGSYCEGGGVYCLNSSPIISRNRIVANTVGLIKPDVMPSPPGYGGGIYCSESPAIISGNTIAGNIAINAERYPLLPPSQGGGIFCAGSPPVIQNNVVWGNSAAGGGGLCCVSSSPVIVDNTVVGNFADEGGGIWCILSSTPAIANTIVALNSSGICAKLGASPTLAHNCVFNPDGADYTGTSPGTGDLSADPQLVAVEFGQVHLRASSPCIDTGDDAALQPGWVDVDGEQRIQGPHADIGADEFNGTAPVFTPRIVRVGPSGDDGNDGSSWALVKRTVQGGVDAAASSGGEVWVAAGTYNERVTLKASAHVYGGFAGAENGRDERDPNVSVTILDGGASGSVVTALSGHRASTVSGFTIRNGTGTLLSDNGRYGGGIYILRASPSISRNTITGNTGYDYGSGIYAQYSGSLVSDNLIAGNARGGVYCLASSMSILNNTITDNTAGGIYTDESSPTISANRITSNHTDGIYCAAGSPLILNNLVTANTWSGVAAYGGSAVIANNTFVGNSISGIKCSAPAAVITNNTIVGNGGGTDAGGIHCSSSSATISNNIVAFNSSGIYKVGGGTPVLRNNCVYNPTGTDYSGLSTGTGDISVDPQLLAAAYGKVHLLAGSPCIDTGDDTAVQAGWVDVDGESRIQGTHVDIGADEFDGTPPLPFTPTVVRVSTTGSDADDGSSWEKAKLTVQAGIDAAAANGGEVWVAAGTYHERITLELAAYVYGGFAGTEASREQRSWASHPTILDGDAGGSVVSSVNTGYRMSCVDGFSIGHGTGTVVGTNVYGGGIYCSSSPLIANDTIRANSAKYGGGLYCYSCSPLVSNTVFESNTASDGGGVYTSSGAPRIVNAIFVGNGATGSGGGMYNTSGSPAVANCSFSGNWAPSGAGFYNYSGDSSLTNCILWDNTGPAMTKSSGNPMLTYCDVQGSWTGTGNIDSDPRFARTPSPGGDSTWGTEDDDYGDLRFLAGSPCIDAGKNVAVPAGVLFDLGGLERFLEDPGTPDCPWAPGTCGTAPIVDMGAYEFMAGDYDRDGDVDLDDLVVFQACVSGPAVGYAGDCLKADFDRDGDADLGDFGVFQRLFSGAKGAVAVRPVD